MGVPGIDPSDVSGPEVALLIECRGRLHVARVVSDPAQIEIQPVPDEQLPSLLLHLDQVCQQFARALLAHLDSRFAMYMSE